MVMTLVFLAMGFLLVIAVRSYFHWQKEELAKHEHLREKVERKGWRFETRPSRHVDLRISGTQDGIHWTIEQGNTEGGDDCPSVTWSSDASSAGSMMLYMSDAQTIDGMRSPLFKVAMKMAETSMKKKGLPDKILGEFLDHAVEYQFHSPDLRERFKVLALDKRMADKFFHGRVQEAIRAWPDNLLMLQLSGHKLSLSRKTANLDADFCMRMVNLGVLLSSKVDALEGFSEPLNKQQ